MKADAEQFREFLGSLPKELSLDRIRSYWTKYAFHFTDVRNAADILHTGKIMCREALVEGSFVDAACPRVIAQTDSSVKSYVRLYFRPRTPTQYRFLPKVSWTRFQYVGNSDILRQTAKKQKN